MTLKNMLIVGQWLASKSQRKKTRYMPKPFFSMPIGHNSCGLIHDENYDDDDDDDDETGDICLFHIGAGFLHFSHTLQISTNKIGLF